MAKTLKITAEQQAILDAADAEQAAEDALDAALDAALEQIIVPELQAQLVAAMNRQEQLCKELERAKGGIKRRLISAQIEALEQWALRNMMDMGDIEHRQPRLAIANN